MRTTQPRREQYVYLLSVVHENTGNATLAGPLTVRWRPIDATGKRLPAGAYFCEIETGGVVTVRRAVVLD